MAEGRIQYVEQLTPEHVWRRGFVNPFRLTAVYVVAADPARTAARWARFAGLLPRLKREGDAGKLVHLECARGRVVIGTAGALSRVLGKVPRAPALAGYALSCSDPDAFAARCRNAGLKVKGNAVTLPAALGGSWLLESAAKEEDR
jgi:hypothetical protein